MRRLLLVGAVVVGAGVCARRCARGHGSFDLERMIERMPENAPPKWMFRNISATRKNTERILELLERERDAGRSGADEQRPSHLTPPSIVSGSSCATRGAWLDSNSSPSR